MTVSRLLTLGVAALSLSACGGSGGASNSMSTADVTGCEAPSRPAVAAVATPTAPPSAEPTVASVQGQNAAFDAAVAAYNMASFEDAATQFDAVASASGTSAMVQRVALRMLGRTRLALGDEAGASDALRRLVANEPPLVRLDPDVEPLRLLETYYAVRHDQQGNYAVRTDRANTLAIADFTNASITDHAEVDPLRLGFASLMINRMRGATTLELVERVRLQWLLDEESLGTGEAAGRQASNLLGADQVVFGTYIKSGNTLLLTARVVDVETGRVLLGERVQGPAGQFDQLVGCLSDLVAGAVGATLPAPTTAAAPDESLDAVIAYARGLSLEESGDYAAAAEQYQLALSISPDYAPAEGRLEEGLAPFTAVNMR